MRAKERLKGGRPDMDIASAQLDMNRAYAGGAPGVFVSGVVWLATGLSWAMSGIPLAFAVMFVGGMAIFPLSTLIARTLLRAPQVQAGNQLNRLGLESTFSLMAGILIGYVLLVRDPQLAIPAVSVVMGARYFSFRTIYGQPLYWLFAGAICAVGTVSLLGLVFPLGNLALAIGAIELILSALLFTKRPAATA